MVRIPHGFASQKPWYDGWHHHRHDWHQEPIVFLLEHHDWIVDAIAHIDGLALFINFWAFGYHQPTDVGEEEAAASIMRVRIRVLILVVHPVVEDPHPDTILMRNQIEEG